MPAPTRVRDLPGGSHIELHRHPEHQLIYCSGGAAQVRTEAGTWIAPQDRAIWIPARHWHEHHFFGPTRFHCIAFPLGQWADRVTPEVLATSALVRELIITCSAPGELPERELGRLRQVLLDQLDRMPRQHLPLPVAIDERLREACALVERDLESTRTLAELGRRVGAGERTLTRLFRTEFAMTYPQWRTHLRLHRAVRLLAEGYSVTTVAGRCGWASPSAFIDVYRHAFGCTPGSSRRGVIPESRRGGEAVSSARARSAGRGSGNASVSYSVYSK
ncbi:putative transcriptional regulator, AraC family protein [Nocardia jinanensis]|uniref:Transcriptional regulator, AraC family protein n=1 Tax=Nocardia jinanensis TaxID=382504 RepID=A0A917RW01_9NOCA|nr:putative transcriptional regulator, AraC family protein [Nocardia jinanensis]